jgi:hypothetical protein
MFISKKEKKDLEQRCIILDTEARYLRNIIRLILEHLKLEIDDIPSSSSKRVSEFNNGMTAHGLYNQSQSINQSGWGR